MRVTCLLDWMEEQALFYIPNINLDFTGNKNLRNQFSSQNKCSDYGWQALE